MANRKKKTTTKAILRHIKLTQEILRLRLLHRAIRVDAAHQKSERQKQYRAFAKLVGRARTIGREARRRVGRVARRVGSRVGGATKRFGKSAWRTFDRVRTTRNHGYTAPEDFNRKLPGFAMSMADYERERAKDREKHKAFVKELDAKSPLGIRANPHIPKDWQAGGAVRAIREHTEALNAQIAKQNAIVLKNLRTKAVKELAGSAHFDCKAMSKRLNQIRDTPTKQAIEAMEKIGLAYLRKITPYVTGTLSNAIRSKTTDSDGAIWFDAYEAPYAIHVEEGWEHARGKHMIRRTKDELNKAGAEAGIKAQKLAWKL